MCNPLPPIREYRRRTGSGDAAIWLAAAVERQRPTPDSPFPWSAEEQAADTGLSLIETTRARRIADRANDDGEALFVLVRAGTTPVFLVNLAAISDMLNRAGTESVESVPASIEHEIAPTHPIILDAGTPPEPSIPPLAGASPDAGTAPESTIPPSAGAQIDAGTLILDPVPASEIFPPTPPSFESPSGIVVLRGTPPARAGDHSREEKPGEQPTEAPPPLTPPDHPVIAALLAAEVSPKLVLDVAARHDPDWIQARIDRTDECAASVPPRAKNPAAFLTALLKSEADVRPPLPKRSADYWSEEAREERRRARSARTVGEGIPRPTPPAANSPRPTLILNHPVHDPEGPSSFGCPAEIRARLRGFGISDRRTSPSMTGATP
jgi:hypothetical protein